MSEISKKIIIKELNQPEQMFAAFEVVKLMYEEMDFETYKNLISEMIKRNDYKMIGAFLDDKIIGACGYWIFVMLYCNRYVQISNLVVDKNYRGLGIGKKILDKAEAIGKENNCQKIVLDSYTKNKKSHSLYFREGYHIRGFHFMKELVKKN
jgi:ribosomal protein S18 acetylase RimI-like enzyme